ncbi:UNVERIFIED_CONTAM: putative LRR receptor-like serine/threonine-protein kinase [Sesamum radiatum]|uniref:LRR receptor-like serine/threonine-protein kinase n=1 Tax=Sesamum radiatum TaxID=300843 RepID=A0AAW2S7M2_SESRA
MKSGTHDNWERLVRATLRREELRRLMLGNDVETESNSSAASLSESTLQHPTFVSFSFEQILQATHNFSAQNLIKRGRSGDLFRGFLQDFQHHVVVKRIDIRVAIMQEAHASELECFSRISVRGHSRFVPLLGHCLADHQHYKFLVYKYLSEGDLKNSWSKNLPAMDWSRRMRIAVGAAEGLAYLHHECNPPLVHGEVEGSSILLDSNFEVRLGSLGQVRAQGRDTPTIMENGITRFYMLTSPSEVVNACKAAEDHAFFGTSRQTCSYDVYCFGKVLMELLTGKLGNSDASDGTGKGWLQETLLCISDYDKESIKGIMDPLLTLDEEMLKEAWAVALIAKSCLNPNPTKRPLTRHVLRALGNPLRFVKGWTPDPTSPRLLTSISWKLTELLAIRAKSPHVGVQENLTCA